jgi:hypothetical protein
MRILCLVIAVLLAASESIAEITSDEDEIVKLENDWVSALEKHDRERLNKILAREFTFIEPDGTVVNRDAYLADRSSTAADIASFEIADVKVRVFGESALVTGIVKIAERRQGNRYRFNLRWKEFWLNEGGNWKVLAGQATPVNLKWDVPFIVTE